VLSGAIRHYPALSGGAIWHYLALSGAIQHYLTLRSGAIRHYLALSGITIRRYLMLSGTIRHYLALSGITIRRYPAGLSSAAPASDADLRTKDGRMEDLFTHHPAHRRFRRISPHLAS
jgi:hypothetical protein